MEFVIYKIILFVSIFLVWLSVSVSRFAKYNENYALMTFAVIVSIMTCISVCFFYYYKKEVVTSSRDLTILYFATSSPMSLYLFFYSFEDIFGQFFYYPS